MTLADLDTKHEARPSATARGGAIKGRAGYPPENPSNTRLGHQPLSEVRIPVRLRERAGGQGGGWWARIEGEQAWSWSVGMVSVRIRGEGARRAGGRASGRGQASGRSEERRHASEHLGAGRARAGAWAGGYRSGSAGRVQERRRGAGRRERRRGARGKGWKWKGRKWKEAAGRKPAAGGQGEEQ